MDYYDVRKNSTDKIERIVFDDGCHIEQSVEYYLRIEDTDGDYIEIKKSSVDNLIKALEKVKELEWY